jgi:predicted dehydrogenase
VSTPEPAIPLAFAGAGWISAVHGLAATAVGAPVLAVASRNPARAAERAEQLGARPCRYEELPAGARGVVVATNPARHALDAMAAAQAGAGALVEKALTTTLRDADRLVEASTQMPIAYAENLAHAPLVRTAVERRPALGAVHDLELRVIQPRPTWGEFLTPAWGGGVLFDLGPHPIAVALLLMPDDPPVEVSARVEQGADIPVDDHAVLALRFRSGVDARLTVSWRAAAGTVWDVQAASPTGVLRGELIPNLELEHNGEPVMLPAPRADLPDPRLSQMGYVDQLAAFVQDLDAGTTPTVGAELGRDVLDVIAGAYASAARGGAGVALPFDGPRDRTPLELWLGIS